MNDPGTVSDKSVSAWRVFDNAPLLLVLTMSFWAGNGVLGKWVALGDGLPPVGLAFWRWIIAIMLILPFALPHLRRDWPALKASWFAILVLSLFGICIFNTLVYWSQYSTTAVNLFLLNATLPLLIPAFSFLLFRDRVTRLQVLSIALALTGAVTIISTGDIRVLTNLAFNQGDLVIITAMASYAIYSVCLRLKPIVHPMTMLLATFVVGSMLLLPFYIWEHQVVGPIDLTVKTMIALAYVGIFPSFAAYLCFNRGVELIGANRASLYFHLMPVIGTVFAVILFDEPLGWYHAVGAVLIITGIVISTRKRR